MSAMKEFYYDEQVTRFVLQFMAIFASLYVQHDDGEFQPVNIRYGSADRVAEAIISNNNQNSLLTLPAFSAYVRNISPAPDRRKGNGTVRTTVIAPSGALPEDVVVLSQKQPIPYDITMELSLMCTNTKQHLQILEQIMMLFDPVLQLQHTDSVIDPTAITTVEMLQLNFDENYPMGAERRIINSTMVFNLPIWISTPTNVMANIIERIKINLSVLDKIIHPLTLDELENGEFVTSIVVGEETC